MKLPLYWIDAFARQNFTGNPAAVVPLETWLPDCLMQQIAFENGLAETAFFVRTGPNRFHLRWFTPTVEVKLCGHATLASAHVLYHQLGHTGAELVFDSLSGPLHVSRSDDLLVLDFPASPPVAPVDPEIAETVTAALGEVPVWLGTSEFDLFAVLADCTKVIALRPDLAAVARAGRRGLIVTAAGDGTCDFVSRFFAPQSGVPEDPVTGSAHCALTPYWATYLQKTRLHGRQVSRRGGELWCESHGDRVHIAGHARMYLVGEIQL